MNRGRRSRGYGLIELLVTVGVMSIVMVGCFRVFQEGMQLFRTNQAAADAQQAAVKVLGLITAEVANATPEVSRAYDSGSGQPPGIVFATSIDDGGSAYFDPVTAEIYWQRYVAFYFEPDPDPQGFNGKIIRAQLPVPDEVSPPPPPGSRDNSATGHLVSTFVAGNPTGYFQTSTSAERRMIAQGISGLEVEIYDGSEGNNTGGAADVSFDITVEAGSPQALRIRNGYYIKVSSRVTPRG